MNFGKAIKALKKGEKVARGEWFSALLFVTESEMEDEDDSLGEFTIVPSICIKTEDGDIIFGWTPTQIDMFATDWEII